MESVIIILCVNVLSYTSYSVLKENIIVIMFSGGQKSQEFVSGS